MCIRDRTEAAPDAGGVSLFHECLRNQHILPGSDFYIVIGTFDHFDLFAGPLHQRRIIRPVKIFLIGSPVSVFQYIEAKRLRGLRQPQIFPCLLYTSPSPRDRTRSRMPSSA